MWGLRNKIKKQIFDVSSVLLREISYQIILKFSSKAPCKFFRYFFFFNLLELPAIFQNFSESYFILEITSSTGAILDKKNRVGLCRCTRPLVSTWNVYELLQVLKKLLKMSKFPNHYILKLFQKFRENFFQNFLSKLTVIYRRCHETTSYVSNYVFFTLWHE